MSTELVTGSVLIEAVKTLEAKHSILHKLVTAGLLKLKQRANHGEPLTRSIAGSLGMRELRVGSTDIARVFFFFQPDREIVCTNGYVKKSQKLDPNELLRAERYKADWEQRSPKGDNAMVTSIRDATAPAAPSSEPDDIEA